MKQARHGAESPPAGDEIPPAGDGVAFAAASRAACEQRRAIVDEIAPDAWRPPAGRLGLALSGGGIRSATLSLGALQALARHNRLIDFDYVSTVSGGGYAGTFLRSLFLPAAARGTANSVTSDSAPAELAAQAELAKRALTATANSTSIADPASPSGHPASLRNPLWWLRQSSRYLAPAGTSDYLYAASYVIRNWLAMIYVFLLPIILIFLLFHGLLWSFVTPKGAGFGDWWTMGYTLAKGAPRPLPALWSPLWLPVAAGLFLSLSAGLGYWLTEWLRRAGGFTGLPTWLPARPRTWLETRLRALLRNSRLQFLLGIGAIAAAGLAAGAIAGFCLPSASIGPAGRRLIMSGMAVILASSLISLGLLASVWRSPRPGFIAELRRRFTATSTFINHTLLWLLAAAVIDSLALLAMTAGSQWWRQTGWSGLISLLLLPLAAWAIRRLAVADGSRLFGWAARRLPLVTLIAGVLLFGLLAVAADALVISLLGITGPGAAIHSPTPAILGFWLTVAIGLTLLTGMSTGFINLSSLHNFYAARLIRAYLGGTNHMRLHLRPDGQPETPITRTHKDDDIDAAAYFTSLSLAPLHLVNVTLNETRNRDGNQLVERDRKGVPLVFGPEGALVDPAREAQFLHGWDRLRACHAEPLTAGQLCAISGAAASTGMGEKSSLGTALTLGFANLRLGYWWQVNDLLRKPVSFAESRRRWLWLRGTAPFRTYFYLGNELTSRYSRDYGRLNLSDGGHFENSGAYELLRRRVKTILVLDNGADPEYRFDDLENLVRKARIDLGLSINLATPGDIEALLGREALALFLNGRDGDWRARAAGRRAGEAPAPRRHSGRLAERLAEQLAGQQAEDPAFALLFNVYDSRRTIVSRMVWAKPRIKADIPQDIIGYGLSHADFPQQSTGDQFYDERQWESYRGLGYCLIDALFTRTPAGADVLRKLC